MEKLSSTLSKFLALAISGLAIGWLMGLSVAPNVQNVITSVLTLVIGIMSILAGISALNNAEESQESSAKRNVILTDDAETESNKIAHLTTDETSRKALKRSTGMSIAESARHVAVASLWPVAGFMAGLVLGGTAGVVTRTNNLLGPNPTLLAWYWDLNAAHQDILKDRLLQMSYGISADENLENHTMLGDTQVVKQVSSDGAKGNILKANTSNDKAIISKTRTENSNYQRQRQNTNNTESPLSSIGILFNAEAEKFCKRTRSMEGQELKVELKMYISTRLNDSGIAQSELQKIHIWQSQMDDLSSEKLNQIRQQICEK